MREFLPPHGDRNVRATIDQTKLFQEANGDPSFLNYPAYANKLQEQLRLTLNITETPLREVGMSHAATLQLAINDNSSLLILMRHGMQKLNRRSAMLKGPEQKIEQMRVSSNLHDPMDVTSFPEAAAVGSIISFATRERDPHEVKIVTSRTPRAAQAAEVQAGVMRKYAFMDLRLNCINYQEDLTTEEILQIIPSGSVPWEEEKIDAVSGKGTFSTIVKDMDQFVDERLSTKGISIAVTHTQQLAHIASRFGLSTDRLETFGMVLVGNKTQELVKTGIFTT